MQDQQQTKKWLQWALGGCILAIVIFIPVHIVSVEKHKNTEKKYPLIAKRLFTEDPNDILINFMNLRFALREYVAKSPEKIGLYFEYLPTGVNINVGANEEFFRASLVKLPVVMRTYKLVEEKKVSLDDVLTVEAKQLDTDFGNLWKRGAGTKLTIRELIALILTQSDNTAFNVLYERINVQLLKDFPDGDQTVDDVYDYLDIPRNMEGVTPMITPKNFSSMLKSLYFSAYLNFENSNNILTTMTGTHSEKWATASIPSHIPVANKIGVYNAEPEELQVHADCGIFYYPKRQYLLCTMVNSADTKKSVAHIQELSKTVYNFIEKR